MRIAYDFLTLVSIFFLLCVDTCCGEEHHRGGAAAIFSKHISFLVKQPMPSAFRLIDCFSIPAIQECCCSINKLQTLAPLAVLWESQVSHLTLDENTTREFSFLLFMVYHGLFYQCSVENIRYYRSVPWLNLISLYLKLRAIPLTKLFDLLDECLDRYQEILNEYGGGGKEDSFLDWLEEYWWLPAMMGGMAFITFVRWLRGKSDAEAKSMDYF